MAACAYRYRSRFVRLVIVLGALALLLSGCDLPWQAKPSDMAKDQTLKMAWSLQFTQPDPAFPSDPGLIQLDNLLYDGLVTSDRDGHIEPWGAESWTISPDGLMYTFRLRPNQRFSDGAAVKPSDYARSIDRSANPCVVSAVNFLFAVIKDGAAFGAESCYDGSLHGAIQSLVGDSIVPNDSANTLAITLAQPAGYFLATLTNPAFFAVERSVIPERAGGFDNSWTARMSQGKTGRGGSGMFYLAAYSNTLLTLRPNPYWWGRHAGKTLHFSQVDLYVAKSPEDAFSQFTSSPSLAFSDSVVDAPPDFPLANSKKQPYYHEQPALTLMALRFNLRTPPFDDLNGRRAFCLAINRDQINQQIYQGAEAPTWSLVPKGLPGYNTPAHGLDNAPVSGSATLARKYWQRYVAAHPNQPPSDVDLGYMDLPDSAEAQVITLLLNSWRHTFGVNFQARNYWGMSIPAGIIFPLNLYKWYGDDLDPQDFLTVLYASDSQFNRYSLFASVPAADALLRQADALSDIAQRIPLYQQAEQLLIDNVAVCPLYQSVNRYALRSWVKGDFVEDARGLFPNDTWITGYIAKH